MRPLVFKGRITIRTDAQLRAAIEAEAARGSVTASDWIRTTLAAAVLQDRAVPQVHPRDRAAA